MTVLIVAGVVLTALGVWLDHRGVTVGWLFGDPRRCVDRAHKWGGDE